MKMKPLKAALGIIGLAMVSGFPASAADTRR